MIKNKTGRQFLRFIPSKEISESEHQPLAGSYAVLQCQNKYLLCYNKWREQWELPAGRREEGESPIDCAKRELYEETGQLVNSLEFKGLIEVKDYENEYSKFNPIFFASIGELQPFIENDETTEIYLWDLKEDIGYIDEVDRKIFDFITE